MPIGVLMLQIHLPEAHSLKDRRNALRRLKDRLRGKYNITIAELSDEARWQSAQIGMAAIGSDAEYLRGLLERAGRESLQILSGEDVSIGSIEILDYDASA